MLGYLNRYTKHVLAISCGLSLLFTLPSKAQIDSALFAAIKNGDFATVQNNLRNSININAVDGNGANALMWAVYYGDLSIVKMLIQHNASVGDSAVIYFDDTQSYANLQGIAAGNGKLELLKYLSDSLKLPLDERAYDPYSKKKTGWSPLSCAAANGHKNIVEYLFANEIKIDIADTIGIDTPLIVATENEQWEIFEWLFNADTYKKRFGEKANHFATVKARLKQLYPIKGTNSKQLEHVQFIIELKKCYFGQSHISYATSIGDLSRIYVEMGEYKKAQLFLSQAIKILKTADKESPQYAVRLKDMAELYVTIGLYEKAIPMLEEAQVIFKKTFGEKYLDYARSLKVLALANDHLGKYDKALPLYLQALEIIKEIKGPEHRCYANVLNNLAFLYLNMGQYTEALALYQQSSDFLKKIRKMKIMEQV